MDWRSQLPDFFVPDKELATFTSLAEAREKISYFLAHEAERRHLAAASRERVLREHTYAHRLAAALETIQDLHPGALPQRQPQQCTRSCSRTLSLRIIRSGPFWAACRRVRPPILITW